MVHPFAALIEAKLARATKAQKELVELCTAFTRSEPVRFGPGVDENGAPAYCVTAIKETPLEIPVVLGEILGNMRSLLDNLIWHLIVANGQDPANSSFPISKSESVYNEARKKLKASAGVLAALDNLKPYDGGNQPLWQLHQLDIRGKHRALVTAPLAMHSTDLGLPERVKANTNALWDRLIEAGIKTKEDERPQLEMPATFFKLADRQCPLKVGAVVFSTGTSGVPLPKEVRFVTELVLHEPPVVEEGSFDVVMPAIAAAVKEVLQKLEPHLQQIQPSGLPSGPVTPALP